MSGGVKEEARKGQMARVLKARLKWALPSDRNGGMPLTSTRRQGQCVKNSPSYQSEWVFKEQQLPLTTSPQERGL